MTERELWQCVEFAYQHYIPALGIQAMIVVIPEPIEDLDTFPRGLPDVDMGARGAVPEPRIFVDPEGYDQLKRLTQSKIEQLYEKYGGSSESEALIRPGDRG